VIVLSVTGCNGQEDAMICTMICLAVVQVFPLAQLFLGGLHNTGICGCCVMVLVLWWGKGETDGLGLVVSVVVG